MARVAAWRGSVQGYRGTHWLTGAPGAQDPTGEAASEAQKHLTLYELDLGLNHVVRKWSQAVDNGANMLVPVPGGADGPGGLLVCAENFIIYKNQVPPLKPWFLVKPRLRPCTCRAHAASAGLPRPDCTTQV